MSVEKRVATKWALASVEARAAAHATFEIPSLLDRETLRIGDLAKLVFVTEGLGRDAQGERMWVEIVHSEAGRYRGRLRNSPVVIQGLAPDDLVEFGPEHVADWVEGEVQ